MRKPDIQSFLDELAARHPVAANEILTVIEEPNPALEERPAGNDADQPKRPFQTSKKWREGARDLSERLPLIDGMDSKTTLIALIMLADTNTSNETWEGLSWSVIKWRTHLSRQSVWY